MGPPSSFLLLPAEIRNPIYDFLISPLPPVITIETNRSARRCYNSEAPGCTIFQNLPNLAYTNRQIYHEILSLLLCSKQLAITSTEDIYYLQSVLWSVPLWIGCHLPLNISFPTFSTSACSPPRAKEIMDFCGSIPGMEQLTLTFEPFYLDRPIPSFKLAEEYCLSALVSCPGLKNVNVMCPFGGYTQLRRAFWMYENLAIWIEQSFRNATGITRVTRIAVETRSTKEPCTYGITIER